MITVYVQAHHDKHCGFGERYATEILKQTQYYEVRNDNARDYYGSYHETDWISDKYTEAYSDYRSTMEWS